MAKDGWKVELYVYDLSQGLARQFSSQFLGTVIEAIWHTGVGVYGKEYYFGGGIQSVPLKQSPFGTPLQVAELGSTQVPQGIFEEYLLDIQSRYTQETYNLLKHNCNNFSDEICHFLVGSGIPEHILRLPEEVMRGPIGPLLRPLIGNLESTLRNGGIPAALPFQAASSRVIPNFANFRVPTSLPSPAAPISTAVSGSLTSFNASTPSVLPPPPSPRSIILDDVNPLVSPARVRTRSKPLGLNMEVAKSELSISEDLLKTSPELVSPAGQDLNHARAKVTQEITQEFALIMGSGSLRASEAAALAARRVLERHRIGGVASGHPRNAA